jgi:O-antigen ligase
LPAAFNPSGVLAFEPLKTSLLRALAIVIAASWLTHRLLQSDSVDVGAHPVVRAGLAFIALGAFSTVFSLEPALSFFGSFDRGMGWLTLAAGGVVLLCASDLLTHARRRERAITALLLGAVFPCGYWLVQRLGLDPVTWLTLGTPGSSLGSPTFLGGYLALVAPFAVYRAVCRAREHTTLAYAGWLALLLVICAVTILATIRGPILGLVAGIVSFAVLARPHGRIGRQEVLGGIGLLLVGLALAVAANGPSGLVGLQRFVNIASTSDSSRERLTVWQDALRIPIQDPARMLVGFGLETQSAIFERGEATVRLTQNQQWDRAHNVLLDAWLTGGVPAVVGLVVLLTTVFRSAWRARTSAPANLLPVAVLAALIGHLVEVSFAFHTPVTSTVFWLILGLAASLSPRPPRLSRPRPTLAALGGLAGLMLVPIVATPAVADALYGAARRADYVNGAQLKETAAEWAPWIEELPRSAALDWLQAANQRDDVGDFARAERDLVTASARAPLEPGPYLRLARLYLMRGDLEAAEGFCERALAAGPFRAAIWDMCADVSARRGLTDEAPVRRARAEELRQPL